MHFSSRTGWGTASGLLLAGLLLTGCPGPQRVEPDSTPTPPPATPEATPPPKPQPPYVPNKRIETGRIFNGMQFKAGLETIEGTTATTERDDPESYAVEVMVRARIPKAHKDLAAISKLNPKLPEILPGLAIMLDTAKVSASFDNLYRLKVDNLRRNLNRLDALLSRHNFYDCETILEIEHPVSKRKVILVQSEMDVDSDGSDGDRVPTMEGLSTTFQPFTSYKWPKQTQQPNPFLATHETKLATVEKDLATPGLAAAKKNELKADQKRLKNAIGDLKRYSFLVGAVDPFIVLPGSMFGKSKEMPPMVGDYAVVIHENVLYPAIVGDVGPSHKAGEGSTRLCKQLNPRATINNRPVSDLKVTYLVFPGTSERPWSAPDLDKYRAKCDELLKDLGGYQGELYTWEDVTKPKPAPVPPAPEPAPTTTTDATGTPATPAPATPAPPAVPTPPAPAPPAPTQPAATPAPPAKAPETTAA
ncbi:MAG: glycoside hydrolase family 75 protein [Chthoniobacteraceae bacterium]